MDTDAYGRAKRRTRAERDIVPPALTEDDGLGAVPGQVVVRLNRDAPSVAAPGANFIASLPSLGDPQAAFAAVPNRSGISALDSALDAIGATALFRVQGAKRFGVAGAAEGTGDLQELADLFVVEFAPDRPTQEAIETLTRVDSVAEVTPSGGFSIAVSMNDPGFTQQWGMLDVRCPEAWDLSQGDPSIVVAVVDTGCDLAHLDLAGQFAGPGTNTISPGQSAQDDHGHGTHVAGIIAAIGNNGLDVAGVALRTKILPVKALDAGGRAVGTSIAQGIAWAASRSSVINCSLQGSIDDISVRAAIDGARRLGVVVVAAMGNFGWGQTRPSYPAAYASTHDNVLAVGAVDRQHVRSVWGPSSSSNTGSWIGIAAPGTNIDSLRRGGGVTTMSGTSQACPHVAGAAALIRAAYPAMTPQEVLSAITGTAQPLRDAAQDPVPNPAYGYGLVDVEAALLAPAQLSDADEERQVTAVGYAADEDADVPASAAVASATPATPAGVARDALADRVMLDYLLEHRPELLGRLVVNPDEVLRELNLDEAALRCPPEAHDALARGQQVADAASELDDSDIAEAIPQLRNTVENAFGLKFETVKIPFGIRFAEEVRPSNSATLTGTASVECTFALSCKPDVDQ